MEKPLVSPWLQQIIGPLVVATVIGLVGDRYRLGIALDDMAATQLKHQIYIKQFNTFRTEGDRFTFEDGEQLREHMIGLVGDCRAAADDIQRLELDIARLPPPKWQERILRIENELSELRMLIRMGSGLSEQSEWYFNTSTELEHKFRTLGELGIKRMDITGNGRISVKH